MTENLSGRLKTFLEMGWAETTNPTLLQRKLISNFELFFRLAHPQSLFFEAFSLLMLGLSHV